MDIKDVAAIGAKSITMPGMVKFAPIKSGSGVQITATDTNRTVKGWFDLSSSGLDAPVLIDGAKLASIVKSAGDKKISIKKLNDDSIQIKAGSSRFKIATVNQEMLPLSEYTGGVVIAEIPANQLRSRLHTAARIAPSDDVRHYLNGVCIEQIDGHLNFVATNGNALFCESTAGTAKAEYILPLPSVFSLIKLIGTDSEKIVKVILYQNGTDCLLQFTVDDQFEFTTSLLSGKFPQWRKVVPVDSAVPDVLSFPLDVLQDAIKRISVLQNKEKPYLIITKDAEGAILKVIGENDVWAEELVEASIPDGFETICLNMRYLQNALDIATEKKIVEFKVSLMSNKPASHVRADIGDMRFVIAPIKT